MSKRKCFNISKSTIGLPRVYMCHLFLVQMVDEAFYTPQLIVHIAFPENIFYMMSACNLNSPANHCNFKNLTVMKTTLIGLLK